MKVIERTPTTLVLRHRPWGNWLAGGFVSAFGVASTVFAVLTEGVSVNYMAVTAIFAGGWAANSSSVSCKFNRTNRQLEVINRTVWRAEQVEVSLQTISAVKVIREGPYGLGLVIQGSTQALNLDHLRLPGTLRHYEAIASEIQYFLGLPLEVPSEQSPEPLV